MMRKRITAKEAQGLVKDYELIMNQRIKETFSAYMVDISEYITSWARMGYNNLTYTVAPLFSAPYDYAMYEKLRNDLACALRNELINRGFKVNLNNGVLSIWWNV